MTSLHTTANLNAHSAEAINARIYGGGSIITPELRARALRVDRADAIMARAFGKIDVPHGFADHDGFVRACRRSAAQKRIRLALIHALPLERS